MALFRAVARFLWWVHVWTTLQGQSRLWRCFGPCCLPVRLSSSHRRCPPPRTRAIRERPVCWTVDKPRPHPCPSPLEGVWFSDCSDLIFRFGVCLWRPPLALRAHIGPPPPRFFNRLGLQHLTITGPPTGVPVFGCSRVGFSGPGGPDFVVCAYGLAGPSSPGGTRYIEFIDSHFLAVFAVFLGYFAFFTDCFSRFTCFLQLFC